MLKLLLSAEVRPVLTPSRQAKEDAEEYRGDA
jgi:hypothetical protein